MVTLFGGLFEAEASREDIAGDHAEVFEAGIRCKSARKATLVEGKAYTDLLRRIEALLYSPNNKKQEVNG